MKRFLSVLIVIAIVIVGLGFYRGWFTLSSQSSAGGNDKVNINLETDSGKIKEDVEKVKHKTADLTGKATDGAKDLGAKPEDPVNEN